MTQDIIVLRHLFLYCSITPVEAATVYKIRSLSSRISALKKRGHKIERKYHSDAVGQRYAKYHITF